MIPLAKAHPVTIPSLPVVRFAPVPCTFLCRYPLYMSRTMFATRTSSPDAILLECDSDAHRTCCNLETRANCGPFHNA